MPAASDQQVQQYVNERVRARAEQVRALIDSLADDKAAIDDVYAACAQAAPTWTDARTDGPPKLLTPQDVLAYNAYISKLILVFDGSATTADVAELHGNQAAVLAACVRPLLAK